MSMDWDTYDQQLTALLQCFAEGPLRGRRSDRRYVAFRPVTGGGFQSDVSDGVQRLLVIGRAANGWECGGGDDGEAGWTREKMKDPLQREKVINRLKTESNQDWLRFARSEAKVSAFWRAARELLFEINRGINLGESWPHYLGWSNLYKISPAKTSPAADGNPSNGECKLQLRSCRTLLGLELAAWPRTHVLIATGRDWMNEFWDLVASTGKVRAGEFVQFTSHMNGRALILAKHPQGKRQPDYLREVHGEYRALIGS